MSVVVTAKDLVVGYGSRPVTAPTTFQLATGRITAIVGQNGSGKTTILKTLAGLLPALGGTLEPPIGMGEGGAVFVHSTPFLFDGTVRRNMLLSSRREERARAALRRLNVEDLWDSDARRLSSGQRQRIALARALAAGPRLLLLDEPEGGLDAQTIGLWRQVLLEATAAGEPCIVLATHRLTALDGLPLEVLSLPDAPRDDE